MAQTRQRPPRPPRPSPQAAARLAPIRRVPSGRAGVRFQGRLRWLAALLSFGMGFTGCAPPPTVDFFVPPTQGIEAPAGVAASSAPGLEASADSGSILLPTVVVPLATLPCIDNLSYLQDLTIPDGTSMVPGQSIDKQWQVRNSGTCNWDDRYRLKLMSGDPLGTPPLQPLYPARGDTDAVIRILFTAPQSAGLYGCQWQAVNPDGLPFGDPFYMQVTVAP